ncbi:hypothetical protein [Pseudobdellovibrio sp. HCB154]|uniref:hypothetical protein n=1 Tax=Pseudobdellovibrio sp. HCB154 TaxID=3386277 RepID=UPI003917629D
MKSMRLLFIILTTVFTAKTFAAEVKTLTCSTAKSEIHSVVVDFPRSVNPLSPFIGFLSFTATVSVYKYDVKVYENKNVRVTPEVYTTDINLRGDAEGVYLRLYPQMLEGEFSHYTGQLFINDLDKKAYFNFKDIDDQPGLDCR